MYPQRCPLRSRKKGVDLGLLQANEQDPILYAIIGEDVGKTRRNHRANPIVRQRPRRMLAARATAKILLCQKNLGTLQLGVIQDKIGVRIEEVAIAVAPVEKKKLAQTLALDGLQELLGDDGIGIDIGPIKGGSKANRPQ